MIIQPSQGPDQYVRPTRAAGETPAPSPQDTYAPAQAETAPVRAPNPEMEWTLARRVAERQLALPQLAREDPRAALPWLGASDPHLRALAARKLNSGLELSQLEKYVALRGPLKGATAQLALKTAFVGRFRTIEEKEVGPALTLLDQAVRAEGKATPSALKTMLRAARNLHEHARTAEVEEDNRQVAAGLGQRVSTLLNAWWRDGLLEVTGPGKLDLNARMAVRGHTLEKVEAPGGDPDTIISLNKPDMLVTMLARSPAGGNELAGLLVQEVLARADEPAAVKLMTGLLEGCEDNPRLQAALRPHLGQLRNLAGACEALSALGPDGRGALSEPVAAYYRELIKAFPETVDERLLRQLQPLLFDTNESAADAAGWILGAMWDKNPALIAPGVQMAMQGVDASDQVPRSGIWRLLDKAGHKSWQPDRLERDWMVSRLNGPPDDDPSRLALWNCGSFEPGLQTLAGFVQRDSHFLEGLTLADRQGQLKPVPDALVDHLLQTPGSEESFTQASNSWAADLFMVIAPEPNPALERRLLAPLEAELGACTHLEDLSPEQRTRFAVLGSMGLTPETRERLDGLLTAALPHHQGELDGLVDRFRGPRAQALWDRFAGPETGLEDRLEAARSALALVADVERLAPYNEMLQTALGQLSPEASQQLERELGRIFHQHASRGLKLDQLGQEAMSEMQLGAFMGREQLFEPLLAMLPGEGPPLTPLQSRVTNTIRFRRRAFNDARLRQPGQPEQHRLAWLDENVQLTRAWRKNQTPDASLRAWAENATGWVAEAAREVPPQEAFRAVKVLMDEEEPAGLLYEVQGRLKGGQLFGADPTELAPEAVAEALEAYQQARTEGLDRKAALDRVLGAVETAIPQPSAGVQETPTHVGVGGVRLRRRPDLRRET